MDQTKASKPVAEDGEKSSRSWVRAILSGAVFGTITAAAMNWLGYHSLPVVDRGKPSFGRNWMSAISGVAAGTVAMYGSLRADDAPPKSVYKEPHSDAPQTSVSADSAEHESTVLSPGQRSL